MHLLASTAPKAIISCCYNIATSLPQSLYLPMKFSVSICTIIPLVINLLTELETKMIRR